MDLRAIREAVAERLSTVPGVRPAAFPPDSISSGGATLVVLAPAETYVNYQEAFAKGLAVVRLVVSPYIPMADPRSAFNELDALLSSGTGESRSLIDALMDTDRSLGAVVGDVVLESVENVQALTVAEGARYLTADLQFRILVGRR